MMITLHPCSRSVKSRRLRRIALPLAILIALFLPNLSAVPILDLGRVFASVRGLLHHPKPAQMMGEEHIVHIPYFTESAGMTSILTLNNNMTEIATAAVTLFNERGEPLTLPAIELAPQLAARFDLGQLANRPDFRSGNVQVSFNGISMGITSQVSVISTARRLAFESVEDEAMDFSSSRLDGILWLPNAETHARIALTNTTAAPLSITAVAHTGEQNQQKSIALGPRETQLVEAREFLGSSDHTRPSATILTLEHNGSPGALMVTGFAINEGSGFSCNFPFVDRYTAVSAKLAGAHVRMGLPNPTEGFPSGTRFSAPLILANVGDQETLATIWLDYTTNSVPHRVQVGLATIAPGKTRQFELSQALAARGIQGPIDDAGVDVTYTGPPGTLMGQLNTFDQTGDFAFDVPIKDPLAGMMRVGGSYPWRLDNGFTTVVHLKNTLNKPVHALVQVRYDGGTYNLERIPLAPFQTIALDIRALRDAQKTDIRQSVMPAEIQSGQVVWFEEDLGSLIGRAEIANIAARVASSFSCSGGCNCPPNYSSSYLNPSSCTGIVGDSMLVQALEMRADCNSNSFGPYDRTADATWNSGNTSIATASGGSVSCVGIGSTSMYAQFTGTVYGYNCAVNTVTTVPNGNITVAPFVTLNAFGSWNPDTIGLNASSDIKIIVSASSGLPSGTQVTLNFGSSVSGGTVQFSIAPPPQTTGFSFPINASEQKEVTARYTVTSFTDTPNVQAQCSASVGGTGVMVVGSPQTSASVLRIR